MAKSVKPVVDGSTPVPYTQGVLYGQLCHLRRRFDGEFGPGTLLAKDGAWDRKAVVAYVVYNGSFKEGSFTSHDFTVGIQVLGRFFADGRLMPVGTRPGVREVEVRTNDGRVGGYRLPGGWVAVEPFTPPKPQPGGATVPYAKGQDFAAPSSVTLPLGGHNGPSQQVMAAGYEAEQAASNAKWKATHGTDHPAAKPSPEAVLDQFLIKDPFAASAAAVNQE